MRRICSLKDDMLNKILEMPENSLAFQFTQYAPMASIIMYGGWISYVRGINFAKLLRIEKSIAASRLFLRSSYVFNIIVTMSCALVLAAQWKNVVNARKRYMNELKKNVMNSYEVWGKTENMVEAVVIAADMMNRDSGGNVVLCEKYFKNCSTGKEYTQHLMNINDVNPNSDLNKALMSGIYQVLMTLQVDNWRYCAAMMIDNGVCEHTSGINIVEHIERACAYEIHESNFDHTGENYMRARMLVRKCENFEEMEKKRHQNLKKELQERY